MKPFARLMLMTLGFGLLAALTGLVGPQPRSTNAAATLAVAVTNTPNVNVANTPNVNVANVPTVNLAPGTTVGVSGGTFSFSNTPATPLFSRDVDNPASEPFRAQVCAHPGFSVGICKTALPDTFTVPTLSSGNLPVRRLLIDFVSGACTAGLVSEIQLSTQINQNSLGPADVPNTFPETSPGSGHFVQQTAIQADAGSPVRLSINSGGGVALCFITVNGHLVTQ